MRHFTYRYDGVTYCVAQQLDADAAVWVEQIWNQIWGYLLGAQA